MKTILIDDFIKNDAIALSEITDFTRNKLIIKGSTGIGGTSAILSITDQTIIIISPYLGMIQDKEKQNTNSNKLFIYQNSSNSWKDVKKKLSENQHFILNTTPDQILKIRDMEINLFDRIKKIPLFIDESHVAAEADYRKSLSFFNHVVFNQWENFFTMSTATPVYKNVDIPNHIQESLSVIKIQKRDSPIKDVTIYNHRFYQEWVLQELTNGRKVVLFTNDENIYRNFLQFDQFKIQVLVGVHLEKKVATFKDANELHLIDYLDIDKDLFILSSKYITGFDIPFDASVAIITNEKSHTDTRYINDIVQAYGRVRKSVINAAIFYNRKMQNEQFSDSAFMLGLKNSLSNPKQEHLIDGAVNHTLVLNEHLPQILRHQTYNSIVEFAENLRPFGFNPTIKYVEDFTVIPSGIILSDMVKYLMTTDGVVIGNNTDYVFNNINGDNEDYNGFGDRLLIIYAAGYIAKVAENDWLNERIKKVRRYGELVTILKTFIDVNVENTPEESSVIKNLLGKMINQRFENYSNGLNEITRFQVSNKLKQQAIKGGAIFKSFHICNHPNSTFGNALFIINTFHAINLVSNDEVDEETLQIMEINCVLSKVLKEDYLSGICKDTDLQLDAVVKKIEVGDSSLNDRMYNRPIKSYFKHTLEKVVRNLSFKPTQEQQNEIEILIDKNIYTLCKTPENGEENIKLKLSHVNYSIKKQKEYHRLYLLGLASLHIAGHMAGFRCSKKFHREYNVCTKATRVLRYKYTPYKMVEVDIKCANAQIIDKLFKTSIGMNVYENLMQSYNISRAEAKVKFNSTLNNYKLSKPYAIEIYQNAGYSAEIAKAIANRTCGSKIYFDMCEAEESIISKYKAASGVQNAIRCHDALIMLATEHNVGNLLESIEGIGFGIKHF